MPLKNSTLPLVPPTTVPLAMVTDGVARFSSGDAIAAMAKAKKWRNFIMDKTKDNHNERKERVIVIAV
jgi:hypothetical protein